MAFLPFIAVAALVYTAVLACYRIYFHPISHIPGPKLAAATQWYQVSYGESKLRRAKCSG
jgi:hypothetical protein